MSRTTCSERCAIKRGTPDHWKIDELASEIAALWPMPAELAVNTACGLMERLWHITGRYAPRGDLGRISDTLIARKVGWPGEASALIAILVRIRWLDASAEFRLLVHDWPHHADDTVKKALENAEIDSFADGSPVRREKPGRKKPPPPEEPELDLNSRTTRESLASASPPSEPSLAKPSQAKERESDAPAREARVFGPGEETDPPDELGDGERAVIKAWAINRAPSRLSELIQLEQICFAYYRREGRKSSDWVNDLKLWILREGNFEKPPAPARGSPSGLTREEKVERSNMVIREMETRAAERERWKEARDADPPRPETLDRFSRRKAATA